MSDFSEVVETGLQAIRDVERHEHVKTSKFYASDAMGCHRQRWFKANDFPAESAPDARGILMMDVGSFLHEKIQKAVLAAVPEGDVEVEVGWRLESPKLGGRADMVIRRGLGVPENMLPCVVEIKTVSGFGFKRMKGGKAPEHRYVLQAALSALRLDAKSIMVVIVNRDSGEIESWILWMEGNHFDEAAKQELIDIWSIENSGKRPERLIPGVGIVADPWASDAPWQCRYCAFRRECAT